jgi:hypothetical protein
VTKMRDLWSVFMNLSEEALSSKTRWKWKKEAFPSSRLLGFREPLISPKLFEIKLTEVICSS